MKKPSATLINNLAENIYGPAALSGSKGWEGDSGVPSPDFAQNGFHYLNYDNGDVYKKEAGVWALVSNLQGPVSWVMEWAYNAEDVPVSIAAGGDGVTTFSALHYSAKAAADLVLTNADVITTSNDVTAAIAARDAALGYRDDALAWASTAEDILFDDGTNPAGYSAFHWSQKAALASGGDTVKISANDTTAANLLAKVTGTAPIVLTETNDGGNESLVVSYPFRGAFGYKDVPGTQSIPNNANTLVQLDVEDYDTDAIFDPATYTFTIVAGVTRIRISAQVNLQSYPVAADAAMTVHVWKNGAIGAYPGQPLQSFAPNEAGGGNTVSATYNIHSPVITVATNDTFDLRVYQNSGVALNLGPYTSWMAIEIIR